MEVTKKIRKVLLLPRTNGVLYMKLEYWDGASEDFESGKQPFLLEFIENQIRNSVNGYLELGQRIKLD